MAKFKIPTLFTITDSDIPKRPSGEKSFIEEIEEMKAKIVEASSRQTTAASILVNHSPSLSVDQFDRLKNEHLSWEVIKGNVPSKSNCYRIITFKSKDPNKKTHPSLAKTKDLKAYETAFQLQCRKYRNAGIDAEFGIDLVVYYDSRRPDLDNSLKVILDCLQVAGAIKNDNLCVDIRARRKIDKQNPRIEFTLTRI